MGRSISWTLDLLRGWIKLTLARFVTILPRLVPKQNEKYFKQYNVQSRSLLISTLPANLKVNSIGKSLPLLAELRGERGATRLCGEGENLLQPHLQGARGAARRATTVAM